VLLFPYLLRLWRRFTTPAAELTPAAGSARPAGPAAAARGPLALLLHQARYDVLASMRSPRARFFSFVFPVVFLVIFASVFGGSGHTTVDGTRVKLSQFFVGGIMAMSIITIAYAGLVVTISSAREAGVLKRRRATPVPPAILIGGQALSTLATAAIASTVLLVVARVGYGVGFSIGALAALGITLIFGTVMFSCLGYAIAGMIGSPDAAQPVVQITMLPLYFISGVFVPSASLSPTLRHIAEVFPVEHLAAAMHLASVRGSFTSALAPKDLAVLAVWAIAAGLFAARRFSWLPAAATG
jgi:ABC-2 type transport system permease protein